MPTLDGLPIFVAKERHFYERLNADIRLRRYLSQMDCDTALIGGSVEGGMTDLIRRKRIEKKGVWLDVATSTNGTWQLITNRTARLKQLKQLGDKMVAMSRYSATDCLTDYTFKNVRTTDPVFRIQINDVNLRLRMLTNNEMDAAWLPEPQATVARLANNPVLMDSRQQQISLGIIAFRKKSINNTYRQNQVDKFIKAYNMACDSINKFGLTHYADIISQYCGVDVDMVSSIPKLTFSHAKMPNERDVELANQFMK
jgi:NitT/TauT family transport system substrate-binding protein